MSDTDEQLMLHYGEGNEKAFELLYQRHKKPLINYLVRQCSNAAIADELFHDVWMQIIKHRKRYKPKAKFTTYMYHIAHNKIIDFYRRQKHGAPISLDGDDGAGMDSLENEQCSTDELVDRQVAVERIKILVSELPEVQREVFLLKEEAGLSLQEIADVTGVNVETAKSRLRYAFNKLTRQLRSDNV